MHFAAQEQTNLTEYVDEAPDKVLHRLANSTSTKQRSHFSVSSANTHTTLTKPTQKKAIPNDTLTRVITRGSVKHSRGTKFNKA